MQFLRLFVMLALSLCGCGGDKAQAPRATAALSALHASAPKTLRCNDKFDQSLYEELGPFTARPNALFTPGDHVPRPDFTRKNFNYTEVLTRLKAADAENYNASGLYAFNTDIEAEAESLETLGRGDCKQLSLVIPGDQIVAKFFPKNLLGKSIAEIGAGNGSLGHVWTQLVGPGGKVFMVDLNPLAMSFMEYKYSRENQTYQDKNNLIIIRNTGDNPCLPLKQAVKLIFIQDMHAYVTLLPQEHRDFNAAELKLKRFWKAVEAALLYDKTDPAKLVVIDKIFNPGNTAAVTFTPGQIIARIQSYCPSLQYETEFSPKDGEWGVIFAKRYPGNPPGPACRI